MKGAPSGVSQTLSGHPPRPVIEVTACMGGVKIESFFTVDFDVDEVAVQVMPSSGR